MNRIIVLGGGVAGIRVARALRFAPVAVTLVEREDFHLFAPDLYGHATGLGGSDKLLKKGNLLEDQGNVTVAGGEAVFVDVRARRLVLVDRALSYDTLVVAAGSQSKYPRPGWAEVAPGLKSVGDAERVREKLAGTSKVVIVGAGPAGVELAAAVADGTRRVVLVEEGDRVLAGFPERLAKVAAARLAALGVDVRCGRPVVGMDGEGVRVSGPAGRERIASRAVVWTGGVEGASFGAVLAKETGAKLDAGGRVRVGPDLAIAGHPEIFVVGDLAAVEGMPLDGLATVASQQARYVAEAIRARLAGYVVRPFEYVDQGRFVRLGRTVVGVMGEESLTGATGWLAARAARFS